MTIHIHYFAILREQRGLDQETVRITNPDLRQLYRTLERAYRFPVSEQAVRPAVNDVCCGWDRPLGDGDRVVFIPPVSGG